MPKMFDASEILEFAVRIEENGEAFYRSMAQKCKEEKIENLFNYLADEEIKHRKTFTDMLSKIEQYEPPESFPGEYFQLYRSYLDIKPKTLDCQQKERGDFTPPALVISYFSLPRVNLTRAFRSFEATRSYPRCGRIPLSDLNTTRIHWTQIGS